MGATGAGAPPMFSNNYTIYTEFYAHHTNPLPIDL